MTRLLGLPAETPAPVPPSAGGTLNLSQGPPTTLLIGSNGDRIDLNDERIGTIFTNEGLDGFGMPEPRLTETVIPGVDGALDGEITFGPREVKFVLHLSASTFAGMRALVQRISQALNPRLGPATLQYAPPGQPLRQITGRYVGGFSIGTESRLWVKWPVTLRATEEIAWTDTDDSEPPELSWAMPEPRPWFPFPNFIRPGTSQVLGGPQEVFNDGDLLIYPDWVLFGPAKSLVNTNLTTGEELVWNGDIEAGKWLAIVTRPGFQEIVDSDGNNRFHELDQVREPEFWALRPGRSVIQSAIDTTRATAQTRFTLLSRRRRYLTAAG